MRTVFAALVILPLLFLAGCGVDLERAKADLAKLEAQATELRQYIEKNRGAVEQLKALAAATGDKTFAEAAAKIEVAISVAVSKLPEVEATLASSRSNLSQLEADAQGKVPWYTVAGGLFLAIVPRVLGAFVPPAKPLAEFVANLAWNAMATKKQKAEDTAPAAKPA